MTDEPKPWRFVQREEFPSGSRATDVRYSDDPEAYPQMGGRILQQGVTADGHPWFYVGVWVWIARRHQVLSLNTKPIPFEPGVPYEDTRDAIIEFASPTRARVRFFSTAFQRYNQYEGSTTHMYDWIVVNIRRQRNKNKAVGHATYAALKQWQKLPLASGEAIPRGLYHKPLKTYDTGFYGVEP